MSEPESHTLAWTRRIDQKLETVGERLARVDDRLGRIEDELTVTSAICLRLEPREVESGGRLAMLERLERRIEALERRSQPPKRTPPVAGAVRCKRGFRGGWGHTDQASGHGHPR